MTVFLVPVGERDYRLYVEVTDAPEDIGSVETERGWIGRRMFRFRQALAEAEEARARRERGEPDTGSGLWRTVMRKIAEAVAEQRLLWHLRKQPAAELRHPSDLTGTAAIKELRAELGRDAKKHLRWTIIDGLFVAVTGPLFFFVPGPNVISWYFTFRAIGHVLSWRGARRGLAGVEWTPRPSAPLADVREALRLPPGTRRDRLNGVAAALDLRSFAAFVERVSNRARS
jgi:hypothetical protein